MSCQMAMMTGERCDDDDRSSLSEAVNALLDCAVRPVGSVKPFLPQTPESERALMHLLGLCGRAPS